MRAPGALVDARCCTVQARQVDAYSEVAFLNIASGDLELPGIVLVTMVAEARIRACNTCDRGELTNTKPHVPIGDVREQRAESTGLLVSISTHHNARAHRQRSGDLLLYEL